MKIFLLNVMLALIWTALTGGGITAGFLLGFAAGAALLQLFPSVRGKKYLLRLLKSIHLLLYFLYEMLAANLRMIYFLFAPSERMKPGIVRVPLRLRTDAGITLLANIITLTPGTLSVDVSDDKLFLYVHAVYIGSPDELREEIRDGFERLIAEVAE